MKKIVLALFLVLAPLRGYAGIYTNPWMIVDPVRTLVGIVLTILKAGEDPLLGAWLNVIQEEVDALVSGDESYVVDEGTGTAAGAVPTEAYDYVSESVLSGKGTPYEPLNSKIGGGNLENDIKSLFFLEKKDMADEEKVKEVEKRRNEYLTTLSKEYIKIAYEVQQKVSANMDSLKTDINGNGSIGAVSGIDQTWKAVNKTLIADIALQIQLMELDAARFLSAQPLELMSEKQPTN